MADKKEKDLTKVSDAAYIRALDSNGNPVLISKADLAQVAAELMPVATITNNGLMGKDDKRNMPCYFSRLDSGTQVFAIRDFSSWVRNGGSVMFVPDTSMDMVYFSVYPQDATLNVKCRYAFAEYKGLEFYTKGMDLFVKVSVPASNGFVRIEVCGEDVTVEETQEDVTDGTYTQVPVQE